jgi:hypothetical protein
MYVYLYKLFTMLSIPKQPNACSCHLCGEKLTAPISYMGKLYGWSCIKKVNPKAKKVKEDWKLCELIEVIKYDGGNYAYRVLFNGKKYIDFSTQRNTIEPPKSIVLNNGNYFINILNFK